MSMSYDSSFLYDRSGYTYEGGLPQNPNYPTVGVFIAFDNNWYDTNPNWIEVTADVREISTLRGRSSDFQAFDGSTAQIVLDNRTRKYDPLNSSSPYYGKLKPRRQIKIVAASGANLYPVFTGFTGGFPASYTEAGLDATVTVSCFDLLGIIAGQQLPGNWSGYYLENFVGARYAALDDPEGSLYLTGELGNFTQITGSVPFRNNPSIAPGVQSASVNIGQGNAYQSRSFDPGFNNIGNASFCFWVSPAQLDATTNISLVEVNSKNCIIYCDITPLGAVQVYVRNTSSTLYFSLSFVNPFKDLSPHHVAVTWNGTDTIQIYIDGELVNQYTSSSSWTPVVVQPGTSVTLKDHIFQDFALYTPSGGTVWDANTIKNIYQFGMGYFIENTTDRITRYLDSQLSPNVPVPSAWRNLTTTPQATVSSLAKSTTVLDGINTTVDSEGGEMFISKSGQLTFIDRYAAISTAAGSAVATFTDDGTGLNYGPSIDIEIDDQNIRNDVSVIFTGGGQVRVSNTTSVDANGTRAVSINTDLATVSQATQLANYRRDIDATVVPSISALEVSTNTSISAWQTILNLELITSKVLFNLTPKSGSAISIPLLVSKIQHSITPERWQSQITGTARYNGWFVLDQSVLDGGDILLT